MRNVNLAGCIILENKSILLLHRIKSDWYELPGGKIDEGETPEEAAIRELKEELCCDIHIVQKVGHRDFAESTDTYGYTWFLARIEKGQKPQIGEPETFDSFSYLPLDRLSKYNLSPNMKNVLNEIQNGKISLEG